MVDGNDGSSPVPLEPFFAKAEAARFSPNLAMFVGEGSIRQQVMGSANRKATPAEIESMQSLVSDAMRAGALGLSTGLAYVPGTYSTTDELIALATTARSLGGIYTSHMRDEGAGVLDSVKETLQIGDGARIPVHISHHKVGGRRQFGQSVQSLALLDAARARGVDVTFDVYPYTASHTGLSLIFPRWALADDGLNARLANPKVRGEVKNGMLDFIEERFGDDPARIQLARCGFDPSLGGKTIADLLKAAGQPLTQSATADMVIELQLKGGCSAIFHAYDEPDVERLMRSPLAMIGSDGSLTKLGDGAPHPRAFGTFPRVLGRYVREKAVLGLEDAVRKMTSFPATRLGLADRGLLREGLAADVTVFDAATIVDRATLHRSAPLLRGRALRAGERGAGDGQRRPHGRHAGQGAARSRVQAVRLPSSVPLAAARISAAPCAPGPGHDHRKRALAPRYVGGESGRLQQGQLDIERDVEVLAGPGLQERFGFPRAVAVGEMCMPRVAAGGGERGIGRRMTVGADQHAAWAKRLARAGIERLLAAALLDVMKRERRGDGVAPWNPGTHEVLDDQPWSLGREPSGGHPQHALVFVDANQRGIARHVGHARQ